MFWPCHARHNILSQIVQKTQVQTSLKTFYRSLTFPVAVFATQRELTFILQHAITSNYAVYKSGNGRELTVVRHMAGLEMRSGVGRLLSCRIRALFGFSSASLVAIYT